MTAPTMASSAVNVARKASRIIPTPVANVIASHWVASQASSSSASSSSSQRPLRVPNPFLAHKNASTGRWIGPRISLRRQADMAKAYPAEFAILPPGPKTPPSAGFEQSVRLNSENPEEAMSIEWDGTYRKREAKVGAGRPYGMRKRFKGHRHEREARVRKIDVKERLEGMEDRIESWKKAKKDTKASTKPSLPF